MTVDSCFLATEDTLIVNENDPGAVIFEEPDEACHTTLEVEYFIEPYRNRNMETLL